MLMCYYSWWCVLWVFQEALFSIAVEAAIPQCAIFRMGDSHARDIHESLSSLQNGRAYDINFGNLTAGSRAEGLALETHWGHPPSDLDDIQLHGGPLGVHVPQGRRTPGRAALRFRLEGCPPAYCKLEVTDVQTLMGAKLLGGFQLNTGCVQRFDGVNWLHTHNMIRQIQHWSDEISGPAGNRIGADEDLVPALVCSDAHPDMDEKYLRRPRLDWPSAQQLEVIKQLPMLLVFTSHKQSHPDEIPLQARLSWSPSEIILISELPNTIKQVYIAVKYAFKQFMRSFQRNNRAADGRSNVGSFHLKMTFLRHMEKRPPTKIRSQLDLMFGLLNDLDGYLKEGKLPHYFLPDCNLLVTVGHEERCIARNVIQHMLSNPLHAILTCIPDHEIIYGKVRPDTLVAAFHQMSSHPTSVKSREDLFQLLGHLDETRQRRYQWQQDDDSYGVSGRPDLMGLVDMLQKQTQED